MTDIDSRPIVVGVDGSPASRAALWWAVEEAERRRCSVEAILAWHKDFDMVIGPLSPDVMAGLMPARMRETRQRVLDEAVAEVPPGAKVRKVLEFQDARLALTIASEDAALLVVGGGAGPARGALPGSVSGYCLRHASCPVVVVRDSQPRYEIPRQTTGSSVPDTS
jgi:nucleotide-binding universal stress UspA family protein